MNILSIGNSFSTNAHRYLPQIAAADGEQLLLCNLYIGGCPLELHYNNLRQEKEAYSYEVYLPGEFEMERTEGVALHEPIEDEKWDIITIQQCSRFSGVKETYHPYIEELVDYCRFMQPDAKIFLHQTWAYEQGFANEDFKRLYHGDQKEMYEALTKAYAEVSIEAGFDDIIPSGRAWQTARQTIIGDRLTEDGFHGNEMGCFLAGACFYEKCFGKSILENSFEVPDYDKPVTELLRACAHLAVEEGILL